MRNRQNPFCHWCHDKNLSVQKQPRLLLKSRNQCHAQLFLDMSLTTSWYEVGSRTMLLLGQHCWELITMFWLQCCLKQRTIQCKGRLAESKCSCHIKKRLCLLHRSGRLLHCSWSYWHSHVSSKLPQSPHHRAKGWLHQQDGPSQAHSSQRNCWTDILPL